MDYTQNGNLNLQRVAPKTWSRTLAPVRNLHPHPPKVPHSVILLQEKSSNMTDFYET